MLLRLAVAVLVLVLLGMPRLPPLAAPAEQGKSALPLRLVVFTVAPALAAARDQGYLEAEGLAVSIDTMNNSTDQMQGFAAGRWDVVHTLFDNLLAYADRAGVQSVAFAVTDVRDLSLYALPEIASYDDLRGRPVAVDAVDTAVALVLRRLLLAHGLDAARGDYELVPAGGQPLRLQSLLRGETAAAMLGPPDSTVAAPCSAVAARVRAPSRSSTPSPPTWRSAPRASPPCATCASSSGSRRRLAPSSSASMTSAWSSRRGANRW
jgi:ABC-type nitrate/sulfonate/bicarbonate transport system substrate-binding protein